MISLHFTFSVLWQTTGWTISQQLIPRIRRILKQEDERMQVSRSLVAVVLSLLVSLAVVTVASAQREPAKASAAPPAAEARANAIQEETEPPATQKPLTAEERARSISIQGTVLGVDGRPARWSQVWLLGHTRLPGSRYGAAQIEASRADANGRFAFWHPRWREHNPGPDEYPILWVLARTRDGTLTMNASLNLTNEYRGKTEIHGLELTVLPQADYSGRIVDENGKPIRGAKVTPELLVLLPPKGLQVATMSWFPELAAEYAAMTNADGIFVLKGMPKSKNILAQISAPSLGARGMFWPTDTQPELRIEPGGTIRGKLTNVPAAEFCSQIELEFSMVAGVQLNDPKPSLTFWVRCRPEADGSFEMTDVPPGLYRVQITPGRGGPAIPQAFYAPVECEVKSGEIADEVELVLPKVIVARGRVVDRESGAGIAGAGVSFLEEQAQSRTSMGVATTNAQGEYRAYLLPRKIAVEHRSAPEGYLTPIQDLQSPAVMRTEDFEGPTLRLERAIKLHGSVVDQEGRPVARADVRCIQPFRTGQGMPPDVASDESGNFMIPQIDPQEALPLRVRTPIAVSTALVVQPGELGNPQRIVISPQNAFRLKGTLTDDRGRPVPQAKVAVHWHRTFVSKKTGMSGLGGEFEKYETDEQGRFESAALWPDDSYHVVVEADGFSKLDLPTVKGKSDTVHDYGPVRLTGTSHAISGRVVDLDGRPIADATVFNSGDAPQIVTTRTGKDGRFRLDGLLAGPVHLFAEHDKYRFAGTYANGTSQEVLLTLTPLSAPAPQRQEVDFDALDAVRRKQAEQLQQWVTTAQLSLRPNLRDSKFAAMVKIDPQETLKQIGQQSPPMDYRSAVLLAKSLTPFQPRKEGLDATDKKSIEVALKFVERAVSRIDDLDATRRMFVKADAGLMFARLREAERGKPLVEAAAKEWSGNPPSADSPYSYTIVTIAQGLAWTDFPRALGLMETVPDDHLKSQIRNRVIVEVSKFDVPRALTLLNDPKYAPAREFYNDSVKFDLAYRIGHVDPQTAADLAATIANPRTKAEACGWTAVAIADQNPQLARSLIDEGLSSLRTHRAPASDPFYYEYVPGVAAHLALQASQIKHPEIESIIQQALALRLPANAQTSTVSRLQSTVNTALFLAFVDPRIAKQLLADLEPALKGNLLGDGGYASVGSREWYYAWVLADPEHAAILMKAEIEKGKDSENRVREAFTLMFLPPAERLDYVRTFSSANVVAPYQE